MMKRLITGMLCAMLALTMLVAAPQEARADAGDVVLVSCTSGGDEAGGLSDFPAISAGGRYVAFYSTASNLVPGVSGFHVYRKDVASGEVLLCSASSDGTPGNGTSTFPAISADGTYVAFRSDSTNLIPGHPTTPGRKHVYRKDLVTGEVMLCSAAANGVEGGNASENPCFSDDGRYVAFYSTSTNLIAGHPTNGMSQVFRKDLASGEVVLCSRSASGVEGVSNSYGPSLNSDGSYVAFQSMSSNLIDGQTTVHQQLFRKNLVTGEVALASASSSGTHGNDSSYNADISAGGMYVCFMSKATNLIDGHPTTLEQVFRKDMQTGSIDLCSSNILGIRGNADSNLPCIDDSGLYVTFTSKATNLTAEATTGHDNVLRKNMLNGEVTCCSVSTSGSQGDDDCGYSSMSADGRFVSFQSWATNLIDGQPTSGSLVFRKELDCVSQFYFAEGYTGPGFQEYLCLGNPGDAEIEVNVNYAFGGGSGSEGGEFQVPAGSRLTVDINAVVGAGREVSLVLWSYDTFMAERPIYFDYGAGWTGGHDVVGATSPNSTWCFAEGYTGPGFDEWICVFNPGLAEARLIFRFQTQEAGEVVRTGYSVPAASRATFKVNEVLGADYQCSLTLQSDQPVVAERPMYFDYQGTGGWGWTGGHCVMGTDYLKREYYFAEGYTGPGFEEWLTLQNPNPLAILVTAVYQFADGAPPSSIDYSIPAETRETIYVPDEVGANRDVSVKLTCDSPFLAERPMYFEYSGTGGYGWTGGHCVIGASFRRNDLFFAEGYTGPGFEEWLCIQNPGATTAHVRITYYTQEEGELAAREADIPASSRVTFNVNTHAGTNYQLSSRVEVTSGSWIIVERPMYFDYNGWTGGHDVVGYGL